jgi:FkbM family methyltransferase
MGLIERSYLKTISLLILSGALFMFSYLKISLVRRFMPRWVQLLLKRLYYPWLLQFADSSREIDLEIVKSLVLPGDHVIDIGANIGLYTNYLSKQVGASGRVYSFEPVPYTYALLKSNLRFLNRKNVVAMNCAISDRDAQMLMKIPVDGYGDDNFYRAHIIDNSILCDSSQLVPIETKRLDTLLGQVPKQITFIKCDVEGHELACVHGASRIIEQWKPAWLIELSDDPSQLNSNGHALFSLLYTYGYKAFSFNGERLVAYHCGDRCVNYWFLMPNHMDLLQNSTLVSRLDNRC